MLDGYDVSLLGWPQEHPLHQQAQQILQERNPNQAGSKSHLCRMLALTPASKRKVVVMTRQLSWLPWPASLAHSMTPLQAGSAHT